MTRKMNRKAAMEMTQNAIMVFFFILLLSIVIAISSSIYMKYSQHQTQNFRIDDAQKTAELVSSMPQIICTKANVIETGCIDVDKISMLKNDKNTFVDYFGYSSITLKTIFPYEHTIVLYENIPVDVTDTIGAVLPVKIYNATSGGITGSYDIGFIQVRKYYS